MKFNAKFTYSHFILVTLFLIILYVSLKSAGFIKSTIEGMDNLDSRARINDINNKRGVPASDIPIGDEDLYILKSEVVPPVCPKCPDIVRYRDKPCPPCPPCGRCPEPSFECKKVPSYKSARDSIPIPVLADFSTFGQ
jgi:hypothetical protein